MIARMKIALRGRKPKKKWFSRSRMSTGSRSRRRRKIARRRVKRRASRIATRAVRRVVSDYCERRRPTVRARSFC